MASRISNLGARAMLDAQAALLDGGAAAGYVRIFTGAAPAETTDADSGTQLGEMPLSDPAFPAAVDNADGRARATANAITSDASADASGVAGHWRAYDSNGVVIDQGDCGLASSGASMELSDLNIVAGGQIDVTSWNKFMPQVGT